MNRHSLGTLYIPLWFFIAYVMLTLGLALFGPLDYVDFPKIKVAAYIGFVLVCCAGGYHFAVESSKALIAPPPRQFGQHSARIPRLFDIVLGAATVALVGYLASAVMSGTLNTSISSLGEAYSSSYEGYQRNTGSYSFSFIAYSLLSAPMFVASIWGLFYFRRIGLVRRALVLTILFGTVLIFTLGSGKMKQLGDFIIYLVALAAIARGASGKGFGPRFIATLSIIGLVAVGLLAYIVSQRYSVMGIDAININQKTSWRIKFDTAHPVFTLFGSSAGFAVSVITGYLSQGYYGLGLTLDSAPTWSHFLGSSYSISVVGERVFGLPSGYEVSYPYLTGLESGWGDSKWYSVFPWFASDFTFIGTGLLFGLFAFWYARAWLESIILRDPYAVLLFTLMTVGLFYVPANNQLMHSPGALATLASVVGLYLHGAGRRRLAVNQVWARRRARIMPTA